MFMISMKVMILVLSRRHILNQTYKIKLTGIHPILKIKKRYYFDRSISLCFYLFYSKFFLLLIIIIFHIRIRGFLQTFFYKINRVMRKLLEHHPVNKSSQIIHATD